MVSFKTTQTYTTRSFIRRNRFLLINCCIKAWEDAVDSETATPAALHGTIPEDEEEIEETEVQVEDDDYDAEEAEVPEEDLIQEHEDESAQNDDITKEFQIGLDMMDQLTDGEESEADESDEISSASSEEEDSSFEDREFFSRIQYIYDIIN